MSTAATNTVRICPECHADNARAAQKCWVCQGSLSNASEVVIAEVMSDPAARARSLPAWIGAVFVLLVSGMAILALVGQAPGLAVLFGIIWVIGLIALLLAKPVFRTSLADSAHAAFRSPANYYEPPPAAASAGKPAPGVVIGGKTGWALAREVLLILAVVALIMIAVVIALFVACFAICMAMMSGTHT